MHEFKELDDTQLESVVGGGFWSNIWNGITNPPRQSKECRNNGMVVSCR